MDSRLKYWILNSNDTLNLKSNRLILDGSTLDLEDKTVGSVLKFGFRGISPMTLENLVVKIRYSLREIYEMYMTAHNQNDPKVNGGRYIDVRVWGGFPHISGHDMRPDWGINENIGIAQTRLDNYPPALDDLASRLGAEKIGSLKRIEQHQDLGPLMIYKVR